MCNNSLRFGLNVDRDHSMGFVKGFQMIYGVLTVFMLHPIAFYLLCYHTKHMYRTLQMGYILNQVQLCLHDIWTCFVFQAYFLLPYPIMHCSGLLCRASSRSPHLALVIEAVFMVNALTILLALLLMMNQKLVRTTSKFKSQIMIVTFVYAFLCLNVFGYGRYGRDVENRLAILERRELQWVLDVPGQIIVFGDIGNIGSIRYQIYIIFLSVVVMFPIRGGLTILSIGILKRHPHMSSRTDRLKSRFVRSLLDQLTIVSVFYIYPIAIIFVFMLYQISFLPTIALIVFRVLIEPMYTINSLMQFALFMSTNGHYKQVLLNFIISGRGQNISPSTVGTANKNPTVTQTSSC